MAAPRSTPGPQPIASTAAPTAAQPQPQQAGGSALALAAGAAAATQLPQAPSAAPVTSTAAKLVTAAGRTALPETPGPVPVRGTRAPAGPGVRPTTATPTPARPTATVGNSGDGPRLLLPEAAQPRQPAADALEPVQAASAPSTTLGDHLAGLSRRNKVVSKAQQRLFFARADLRPFAHKVAKRGAAFKALPQRKRGR